MIFSAQYYKILSLTPALNMKFITKTLTPPTLKEVVEKELYDARRKLLEAQTGLEYAQFQVQYHQARIKRLEGLHREYNQENIGKMPITITSTPTASIGSIK